MVSRFFSKSFPDGFQVFPGGFQVESGGGSGCSFQFPSVARLGCPPSSTCSAAKDVQCCRNIFSLKGVSGGG